jgi:excisionase family DNA binding protein
MPTVQHDPVAPQESEKPRINMLSKMFHRVSEKKGTPKLVGPDGFEIELPNSVFEALCQVIYYMMHEQAVSIIPFNKEITTQEAADILNVSRPYLIKLVERGDIPFTYVGSHRRIRFSDLMAYRKARDAKRATGLAEITHISEDEGMYD